MDAALLTNVANKLDPDAIVFQFLAVFDADLDLVARGDHYFLSQSRSW